SGKTIRKSPTRDIGIEISSSMFFQTKKRYLQPEWMDQPDLEVAQHTQALRGLERINVWRGSSGILWPTLRSLALSLAPQPVRVLDLATGGGDIAIRLWRRACRAGLAMEMAGCDRSKVAVDYARRRARDRAAQVTFFCCDVLLDPLPDNYDALICSLFLH